MGFTLAYEDDPEVGAIMQESGHLAAYQVWSYEEYERGEAKGKQIISHEACFLSGDWGATAGPIPESIQTLPAGKLCYYCRKV